MILVGTGEPNLAFDSYYGLGILRSSDGGAHWNLITAADGGNGPFAGLGFGGGSPAIVPTPDTATPTGTYTLTVTATSGGVSHSTDLTLIVQ